MKLKVKVTFTEEVLGTASANPELHEEFIAAKSADKEKIKEELSSLPTEDAIEKAITVFHRDANGNPILYDYQIKGFIKEAVGMKVEFTAMQIGKAKLSKWTHKRVVDNFIFVSPRVISLEMPEGGEVGYCTRPLRASTLKGDRVALATSETVPAGTTCVFEINTLEKAIDKLIPDCLDYGALKGIGQWRNSGKGRFEWEEIK